MFKTAAEAVEECVRTVGEKLEQLSHTLRPQEMTIEFSLSFEATGKASVIPIFLTGETSGQAGLKVTAVWRSSEAPRNGL